MRARAVDGMILGAPVERMSPRRVPVRRTGDAGRNRSVDP